MSAVITCPPDRSVGHTPAHRRAERELADVHAGGRLTLEQRLDSVWEGLRAGGTGQCPVCAGELAGAWSAGAVRCGGCGSVLS